MGYPHPDLLLEVLDSRQFAELELFYSMEPFGDLRNDFHIGQLMSLYVNSNTKKGSKRYSPREFMTLTEFSNPQSSSIKAKIAQAYGRIKDLADQRKKAA